MTEDIEIISDDEGLVVVGSPGTVERWLGKHGLLDHAFNIPQARLRAVFNTGASFANAASAIAERSGSYLKLTPESAQKVRDLGLMETSTPGVKHAMVGDPGKISTWIQVEDGPSSLLSNPAALANVGTLLIQLSRQSEARQLKALLLSIDEKLDDVRRKQRDADLAKLLRAADAISEASNIVEHGGDLLTVWTKVVSESGTLFEAQRSALLDLDALSEKVDRKQKVGELSKAAAEIERQIAVLLAVLGRTFELQDEFRVLEIEHVRLTAPTKLDGHRAGLASAQQLRRELVLEKTGKVLAAMEKAGGIANANILLHFRAAHSIIGSGNSAARQVSEFYAPLGIESGRDLMNSTAWIDAVRDPKQLLSAGKDVGKGALVVGGSVAAIALASLAKDMASSKSSS